MNRMRLKGMTLLEVTLASSILTVLVVLAMSSFVDVLRMVSGQDAITRMDQQANRTLREVAELMKPAILPVFVNKTAMVRNNESNIFYDIDHREHGFSGELGKTWLERLREGMDAIVFVLPIDAQGVGDFLDDANHLQIGQIRAGTAYLSAQASGTPGQGVDFVIRQSGEVVNAIAAIDPDKFASDTFAQIATPTESDWRTKSADPTLWPTVTAFMAIRFVPVLDLGGSPVVINEANVFQRNVSVDLDGNGDVTGSFEIGRLQLVYSGGDDFYHVEGSTVVHSQQPQVVVPLTSNVVLRRQNPTDRTPIFRLVGFDKGSLDFSDSDSAGQVKDYAENGKMALSVKLLLLENDGIVSGKPLTNVHLQSLRARWYETTVALKNMER